MLLFSIIKKTPYKINTKYVYFTGHLSKLYYNLNILIAMLKYTNTEHVSTSVVINGAAIIAGSTLHFLAIIGSIQPIHFDKITVPINDKEIVKASKGSWYISKIRKPFTADKITLTINAIRNSLNKALKKSEKWISSKARPRMIIVEVCAPQFPPVSINIGIKETNNGMVANAFSYSVIIAPVKVADNINNSNQRIRFLACFKTDVLK